jgi:hypothetical protein
MTAVPVCDSGTANVDLLFEGGFQMDLLAPDSNDKE